MIPLQAMYMLTLSSYLEERAAKVRREALGRIQVALAGAPPNSFYTTVVSSSVTRKKRKKKVVMAMRKLMRVQLERRLYTPRKALQDLQPPVLCHLI